MNDKEKAYWTAMELLPHENADVVECLVDLIKVFTDGRNYNTQNPYTRPEIKKSLKLIAKLRGRKDWLDALDGLS